MLQSCLSCCCWYFSGWVGSCWCGLGYVCIFRQFFSKTYEDILEFVFNVNHLLELLLKFSTTLCLSISVVILIWIKQDFKILKETSPVVENKSWECSNESIKSAMNDNILQNCMCCIIESTVLYYGICCAVYGYQFNSADMSKLRPDLLRPVVKSCPKNLKQSAIFYKLKFTFSVDIWELEGFFKIN